MLISVRRLSLLSRLSQNLILGVFDCRPEFLSEFCERKLYYFLQECPIVHIVILLYIFIIDCLNLPITIILLKSKHFIFQICTLPVFISILSRVSIISFVFDCIVDIFFLFVRLSYVRLHHKIQHYKMIYTDMFCLVWALMIPSFLKHFLYL